MFLFRAGAGERDKLEYGGACRAAFVKISEKDYFVRSRKGAKRHRAVVLRRNGAPEGQGKLCLFFAARLRLFFTM